MAKIKISQASEKEVDTKFVLREINLPHGNPTPDFKVGDFVFAPDEANPTPDMLVVAVVVGYSFTYNMHGGVAGEPKWDFKVAYTNEYGSWVNTNTVERNRLEPYSKTRFNKYQRDGLIV